jgi:hypothetical protein
MSDAELWGHVRILENEADEAKRRILNLETKLLELETALLNYLTAQGKL